MAVATRGAYVWLQDSLGKTLDRKALLLSMRSHGWKCTPIPTLQDKLLGVFNPSKASPEEHREAHSHRTCRISERKSGLHKLFTKQCTKQC